MYGSQPLIRQTPLVSLDGRIFVKDETRQVTGAFKFRGNAHFLAGLPAGSRLVTASTGNHGLGMAWAARHLGHSATVFAPATTPQRKRDGILRAGAQLLLRAGDYDRCTAHAHRFARRTGATYVHSFDEEGVVAGHQTLCAEVDAERPDARRVYVPVGGGGLLGACLLHWRSGERVVGVVLDRAPTLLLSAAAKRRVELADADTPAGALPVEGLQVRRIGRIAFEAWRRYRPAIVVVGEAAISEAMRLLWCRCGIRAEPAGAASVAAALALQAEPGPVVCVVTGGNVDDDVFDRVIGVGSASIRAAAP